MLTADMKAYKRDYYKKRAEESKGLKEYEVIRGKTKRQILPEGAIEELRSRLEIDETSKTGLRWRDVDKNKKNLKGKPAGSLNCKTTGYFVISNLCIQGVLYKLAVAHIIWMLSTNKMIESGFVVNHKNRIRTDNRIENLTLETVSSNNTNKVATGESGYKNVHVCVRKNEKGEDIIRYSAKFKWLGVNYHAPIGPLSIHACYMFIAGWEYLTSGAVPLDYIKSQTEEYLCGSDLKRAMKECTEKGIPFTPPKYKTLYEYIASVEGS